MKIINGKILSDSLNKKLSKNLFLLKKENSISPSLVVILVGNNSASSLYVRNKEKKALEVGIKSYVVRLNEKIKEEELLSIIQEYNERSDIDGILVQLPLPLHINSDKIIDKIDIEKDVDGFNSKNIGLLALGRPNVIPCTPLGCYFMLDHFTTLKGKNVTIIGRSNIVGKPLSYLLTNKNATVTLVHSKSLNIKKICSESDIIVAAIGKPNFIKKNWVNKNSIIIDVGINVLKEKDGTKKIVGDVDYLKVSKEVKAISPVPGGVGPMTIHCLLLNTYLLAKKRRNILQ